MKMHSNKMWLTSPCAPQILYQSQFRTKLVNLALKYQQLLSGHSCYCTFPGLPILSTQWTRLCEKTARQTRGWKMLELGVGNPILDLALNGFQGHTSTSGTTESISSCTN